MAHRCDFLDGESESLTDTFAQVECRTDTVDRSGWLASGMEKCMGSCESRAVLL
jgi:hypothetical protein